MKTVTLGRSGLVVPRLGFGALPIQRVPSPEAEQILRAAYQAGVRCFDTARFYSDSEAKRGPAFCRGCGYCLPCPAEIPLHWAARMPQLLRRAPPAGLLTPQWQEQMARIEACTDCGDCASRCPYRLDTPALLRAALADYRTFF